MPEVEWVKERAACSAAAVFGRLLSETRHDVEVRNGLRADGAAYVFRFESRGDGEFWVIREGNNLQTQSISFTQAGKTIRVESSREADVAVKFEGTVSLTEEGQCRVMVGREPLEEWQVRKRALDNLFFEFRERL